jgi:hypothetical protein
MVLAVAGTDRAERAWLPKTSIQVDGSAEE